MEFSDTEHTVSRRIHFGMMASPGQAEREAPWEEFRAATRQKHNVDSTSLVTDSNTFRFPFLSENLMRI